GGGGGAAEHHARAPEAGPPRRGRAPPAPPQQYDWSGRFLLIARAALARRLTACLIDGEAVCGDEVPPKRAISLCVPWYNSREPQRALAERRGRSPTQGPLAAGRGGFCVARGR